MNLNSKPAVGKSLPSLCIDARMVQHSGIGMYLRMLLPYLFREFSVTLLGPADLLATYKSEASIIPFNAPIYSIAEQRQYRNLIPVCDLFWSPHYNVPLLPVKARKRVVTIHDVFHLAFFSELSLKQKIYAKLVINRAVKASNAIITVSEFSKSEIVRFTGAKPGDINVVYNGVKQEAPVPDGESVNTKYNLPEKHILYVGNVKPHKNLKGLVQAYAKLPTALQQEYKIVVVGKIEGFITGDEGLFNLINSDAGLKNSVVFTGFVDDNDMDAIYAGATVFVLPSIYEGFGLPPLEAMLNNCPVLVSNQNSLPEVCGDAALYFDPYDAEDIARQLDNVLTQPDVSNELVAKGIERVKLFTWAGSARRHIELFNNLIQS